MRAGLAAMGGLQGLLRGNASGRRATAPPPSRRGSQSAGEASADAATTARVDQRGAAGRRRSSARSGPGWPPGSGAITTVGTAGTVDVHRPHQPGRRRPQHLPARLPGRRRRPAARANREANATDDQPRRPRTSAHRQWRPPAPDPLGGPPADDGAAAGAWQQYPAAPSGAGGQPAPVGGCRGGRGRRGGSVAGKGDDRGNGVWRLHHGTAAACSSG